MFNRRLAYARYKTVQSMDMSYSCVLPTISLLSFIILNEGDVDDGGAESAKTAKGKKDTDAAVHGPMAVGRIICLYNILYYCMYIEKTAGLVSYIFPCFNLHPRCHTIILAINIIVYLCVLLIPTRVGRAQNLILFISLLSALVNSLFFVPLSLSLSLLVTHLSCTLRYAVFLSEIQRCQRIYVCLSRTPSTLLRADRVVATLPLSSVYICLNSDAITKGEKGWGVKQGSNGKKKLVSF
jgi:hypothetical protein